jgi:hypothetical protein
MKQLFLALAAALFCQSTLAQSKLGAFATGFNKGYSDSLQIMALGQQEEMLAEQLKMQRLELRGRSGLRNLQALEAADRRASERLAQVLLESGMSR